MMKPRLLVAIGVATWLLPLASHADWRQHAGNSCNEASGNAASNFSRDAHGYGNIDPNGSHAAVCAFSALSTDTGFFSAIGVHYYDGNSSTSLGDLSCTLTVADYVGNLNVSSTLHSCATAGGCSTGGNTFSGYNNLLWTNPFGTGTITGIENAYVNCSIPAQGTPGTSVIASYSQQM